MGLYGKNIKLQRCVHKFCVGDFVPSRTKLFCPRHTIYIQHFNLVFSHLWPVLMTKSENDNPKWKHEMILVLHEVLTDLQIPCLIWTTRIIIHQHFNPLVNESIDLKNPHLVIWPPSCISFWERHGFCTLQMLCIIEVLIALASLVVAYEKNRYQSRPYWRFSNIWSEISIFYDNWHFHNHRT